MRRFFAVAVVMLGMLVSARGAAAQLVDPSTGIMVDAASDPMDFAAVASGQPGNVGMEAMMAASATIAQMNANAANSDTIMDSMNAANANDDTPAVAVPALPTTPKPVIAPGGGTFRGNVQVTLADSDAAAVVFYTTNGRRPTTSSQRYGGPIAVSSKTKVEALAFDVNMQPSGVVSKTFKVKAAKGS